MSATKQIVLVMVLAIVVVLWVLTIDNDAQFHSPIATPATHHIWLPSIRYNPGCPKGCLDVFQGSSEGCWIKGVVTGMGDRLYYLPEVRGWHEALLIVKYGGRWFCTEGEAVRNGFDKAQ